MGIGQLATTSSLIYIPKQAEESVFAGPYPGEMPYETQVHFNSDATGSLEEVLKEYVCEDFSVQDSCSCANFIEPNEKSPHDIIPHLQRMSEGLIVSVGTARCFFDLLLSDPAKCTGLVIRDINPRVKAFMDFELLLFRLAETREEFCELAKKPACEEERYDLLMNKIDESPHLPEYLKEYYRAELASFVKFYYPFTKRWSIPKLNEGNFNDVNYYERDDCFEKIQQYARAGKIVTTIGSINELSFLRDQKIAVVDVSNVSDYEIIGLQGVFPEPPLIIWTILSEDNGKAHYFSYVHSDLSFQDREEMDQLLKRLKSVKRDPTIKFALFLQDGMSSVCDMSIAQQAPMASYSREALLNIRKYCEETIYEVPDFGSVLIEKSDNICKINDISDELLKRMIIDPKLKRFIPVLVKSHFSLEPSRYLDFIDVPGWKEAFEEAKNKDPDLLPEVLNQLRRKGLEQDFIERFGADQIARWVD